MTTQPTPDTQIFNRVNEFAADSDKEQKIAYGVDMAASNGDKTAISIRRGGKMFTYVDEEAEIILAIIEQKADPPGS